MLRTRDDRPGLGRVARSNVCDPEIAMKHWLRIWIGLALTVVSSPPASANGLQAGGFHGGGFHGGGFPGGAFLGRGLVVVGPGLGWRPPLALPGATFHAGGPRVAVLPRESMTPPAPGPLVADVPRETRRTEPDRPSRMAPSRSLPPK